MPVEPDPQRQQSPLVIAMIAVVVAALVFWGIWKFLAREHHTAQQPPQPISKVQRQHIVPTGGEVLDGVYRPSGDIREWTPYPLTTLRRCTVSAPNAGSITSNILRTSSKL